MTKKHILYERTGHIDVRMYFIRDMIAQGVVVVKKKIPTMDNPIYMMTKYIPSIFFIFLIIFKMLYKKHLNEAQICFRK